MNKEAYLKEIRRIYKDEKDPTVASTLIGNLNNPSRVFFGVNFTHPFYYIETILNNKLLAFVCREWSKDKGSIQMMESVHDYIRCITPLRNHRYEKEHKVTLEITLNALPKITDTMNLIFSKEEYEIVYNTGGHSKVQPQLFFKLGAHKVLYGPKDNILDTRTPTITHESLKLNEQLVQLQKYILNHNSIFSIVKDLLIELRGQVDAYNWEKILEGSSFRIGYLGEQMIQLAIMEDINWSGFTLAVDTLTAWRETHNTV